MNLFWFCLRLLPVVVFFGAPVAIFLTYGLAVSDGHVNPLLPYISDTGTKPPESCIFTFCLSISSFLIMCLAYIRYREVYEIMELKPLIIRPIWNTIAVVVGFTSALALNIVASFQELNELTTHLVGAVMCFFSGTAYFIIQAVFTRRLYPEAKALFIVRVTLAVFSVICLVGTFAPVHYALRDFKGEDILHWSEEDGGYMFHLISTFCEWFLILTFVSYMYSFFWDFRKFEMYPPAIKFKVLNKPEAAGPAAP